MLQRELHLTDEGFGSEVIDIVCEAQPATDPKSLLYGGLQFHAFRIQEHSERYIPMHAKFGDEGPVLKKQEMVPLTRECEKTSLCPRMISTLWQCIAYSADIT